MNKTQVARECAEAMHEAEAAMEATVAASKQALESLKATKVGLGLTGTMGDACIARWEDSVRLLEESMQAMAESHGEGYRVLKAVNIRGTAFGPLDTRGFAAPQEKQVA